MEPRVLHSGMVYMSAKNWNLHSGASEKVHSAVRKGILVRPSTCSMCNCEAEKYNRIVAHHDDYAKPLDVRWVCRRCHTLIHYPHRLIGAVHNSASMMLLAGVRP